ncbi:hypothetical protein SERLADRAFT_395149 [Serpula lacrymans var. lacrymans S7.9]|uniref:Uncharacterized protein n=1 Tax=Serpula lacrymans var. lacrymans (strain S7.9) TaxID=578457 RepID=F8P401_SERL9|nr:uncharacterized protein SERLADRAFT_395149 [Serpula lacrymans var. lacrymans S7.9]EGO22249.1 hypothetical protein SERLADRAFT_395149 [Serpula lacrymans var. lacrymans S7.9]
MHDTYEHTKVRKEDNTSYSDFCRQVGKFLLRHQELISHPRLHRWVDWGRKLVEEGVPPVPGSDL